MPDTAAVIDRMYDALSRGDIVAARACLTPDFIAWHNTDRITMAVDEVVASWSELGARFTEISFVDVRRSPVPGGWVQRMQVVARPATGTRMAWPCCVFMTLRDGLIARADEYVNSAPYEPVGDDLSVPGLPPADLSSVL